MDILFVQNIWFEFLGTMSLIASVKDAGYRAGLIIGKDRVILKAVKTHRPRIVAFSCVTGIHNWALNLCHRIKTEIDPGIKTVMGGSHPTFFPEILNQSKSLDFICVGEGEGVIIDLLNHLDDEESIKHLPNIHGSLNGEQFRNPVRNLMPDLDTLPFMERDAFYRYSILRDNPVKRFITGRGCPYSCTFCFNHCAMNLYRQKGPYVRKRSVDNVLAEIESVSQNYPIKTIRFEDDLFGVKHDWLFEFCEKYPQKFDFSFICSMRADSINEHVVKSLKKAGCFNVVMGVESGNDFLRNKVLKKNISDDQLIHAAELFHKYNLNFCTTNILGLPKETLDDALETISFNLKLNPTFTWCSIFQPYPRTELGNRVVADNLVEELDVDKIEPNYHSKSLLNQKDIHRSVNLHKFFYLIFNHPSLLPLARRLSILPPNPLFTLIHRFSFLLIYAKRWDIPIFRAIREAMKTTGFTRNVKRKEDSGNN